MIVPVPSIEPVGIFSASKLIDLEALTMSATLYLDITSAKPRAEAG